LRDNKGCCKNLDSEVPPFPWGSESNPHILGLSRSVNWPVGAWDRRYAHICGHAGSAGLGSLGGLFV